MRSERERTADCLDAEAIAAYVDGTASSEDRDLATRHLASCERCYETVTEALALLREVADERQDAPLPAPAPVRPRDSWRWGLAAGLALAASLVLVAWLHPFGWAFTRAGRIEVALGDLADHAGAERLALGRLGPPFEWAPAPSAERGAAGGASDLDRASAVLRLRGLTADATDGAALEARGIAALADGRLDDAIADLTAAVAAAPGAVRTRVALSAAYLERWRVGLEAADAAGALDAAELALADDPSSAAARFNKALALEAMGFTDEAMVAWEAVLVDEAGTPWADEAEVRLARLRAAREAGSGSVATLDAGALAEFARDAPWRLERFIDEALQEWADAPAGPVGRQVLLAASALDEAERDAFWPRLVAAAGSSDSQMRRGCVAAVVRDVRDARAAYDASFYAIAVAHAEAARRSAPCAGLALSPFVALRLWAEYWASADRAAVVSSARSQIDELVRQRFWTAAGRMEYLDGVHAVSRAWISDGLVAYGRAYQLAERGADPETLAILQTMRAEAYREVGQTASAWRHHQGAVANLERLTPRRRYLVLVHVNATALAAGLVGVSRVAARLIAANAEAWADPVGHLAAAVQEMRTAARQGHVAEAVDHLASARTLLASEELDAARPVWEPELALAEGQLFQRREPQRAIQAYDRAIRYFGDEDGELRVPEARLGMARAALATEDVNLARQELVRGVERLEAEMQRYTSSALAASRWDANWDLYGDLVQLTAEDPMESLAWAERSRARARRTLGSPGRVAAADHVPDLPDRVAAVVHAALADELLVWTVFDGKVDQVRHRLPATELARLASAACQALAAGRDTEHLRALAGYLVPSSLAALDVDAVVFVPDPVVSCVPFAALSTVGDAAPLITRHRVVTAPSLEAIGTLPPQDPSVAPHEVLVGYGRALPEQHLPALPDVVGEIQDLVRLYPRARRLEGDAATPERVLSELQGASLVHVAGHAVTGTAFAADSRLVLAPGESGRVLRAEDLAAVRLAPGAVAVLSACETAGGTTYRGEGPMSLARGFLAAGASTVVATLWPVRDVEARQFVVALHERLRRGHTAAQAYAEIAREALASGDRRWQAFVVIGDGS